MQTDIEKCGKCELASRMAGFPDKCDEHSKPLFAQGKDIERLLQPITTPSGTYLCVGVPEDAKTFRIRIYPRSGTWFEQTDSKELNAWKVKLPKGDYEIIGEIKVDSMDDECTEMIESWDEATGGDDYQDYYKNYEIQTDADYEFAFHFTEPESSVRSLITYNKISIPTATKLVVLKKNN